MIVYQADKRQFIQDTFHDDIEAVLSQQYLRTTGRRPSPSEFNAWKFSLFEVGEVLRDAGIPDDVGVALEYTVPQTSKRIDVLLTGEDDAGTPKLIIIELKQWSEARFSEKDGIIWARRGGRAGLRRGERGPHPYDQFAADRSGNPGDALPGAAGAVRDPARLGRRGGASGRRGDRAAGEVP